VRGLILNTNTIPFLVWEQLGALGCALLIAVTLVTCVAVLRARARALRISQMILLGGGGSHRWREEILVSVKMPARSLLVPVEAPMCEGLICWLQRQCRS
jgi:hypothetical protein